MPSVNKRIRYESFPADYRDGQVLRAQDVNQIIKYIYEGVNANKKDLDQILTGRYKSFVYYNVNRTVPREEDGVNGDYAFIYFNDETDSADKLVLFRKNNGIWVELYEVSLLKAFQRLDDIDGELSRLDVIESDIEDIERDIEDIESDIEDINLKDISQDNRLDVIDDEVIRVEQKVDTHIEDLNNPHGVTAEQVDTYVKTAIDNKDANTLQEAKDYTYSQVEIDDKDTAVMNEVNNLEDEFETFKTNNTNKINAVENGLQIQIDEMEFVVDITLVGNDIKVEHRDGDITYIPINEAVESGYYDTNTEELVLELANGNDVRIPAGDIVAGLASVNYVDTGLALKENKSNKITELVGVPDNTQYMSAKLTNDLIVAVRTEINSMLDDKVDRQNATASGNYSTALGQDAIALGTDSIALGRNAKTSEISTTALGHNATAELIYSIALGSGAKALGLHSIAIGASSKAEGQNSIAIGPGTEVTEDNIVDFGFNRQVRVNETPVNNRDAVSKKYLDNVISIWRYE